MSAGVLYFSEEHAPTILKMFALREDDDKCPMRTHYGGVEQGTVVTINDPSLSDLDILISDNGELLTVREIKATEGAGKAVSADAASVNAEVDAREEENRL